MKRLLTYLLLTSVALIAKSVDWVKDTEPAILEVYYTRTEVTDTTKRDTRFFNEETVLRIGKGMSRYCSVPHFYRDSLMYCAPTYIGKWKKLHLRKILKNMRELHLNVADITGVSFIRIIPKVRLQKPHISIWRIGNMRKTEKT